jgi:hypothetical protein
MIRSASILTLFLVIAMLLTVVVSLATPGGSTGSGPSASCGAQGPVGRLDRVSVDPVLVGSFPAEARGGNTRNPVLVSTAAGAASKEPIDPCDDLREQVGLLLRELGRTPAEVRREAFSATEMATFFEMELSAIAEAVIATKERLVVSNQDFGLDFRAQAGLACWWIPDYGGGGVVAGPPPRIKLLVWDPVEGYAQEAVLTTGERARWVMLYAGLHRSTTGDYPAAYFSRD